MGSRTFRRRPWRKSRLGILLLAGVLTASGILAGFSAPAVATAVTDCVSTDNGDPTLTTLNVTPSVDVTAGARVVSFSLTATDLGGPGPASGVKRVELSFGEPLVDDPADTFHQLHRDGSGAWVAAVTIPRGSRPGPWRINSLLLRDSAGNGLFLVTRDLDAGGFPTRVDVTSTRDTEGPELIDLTVTPGGPVDTRRSTRPVTFKAVTADDISGVAEVSIAGGMRGVSITDDFDGDFIKLTPVTGTTDTFEATERVRRWTGGGTWRIRSLWVDDKVGHSRRYSYNRLGELGFKHQLKIVGGTDQQPPRLVRFALDPTQMDVRNEDGQVAIKVHALDQRSGVRTVAAAFGRSFVELRRVSGTARDGVWKGTLALPRCANHPPVRRVRVGIGDGARGYQSYSPAALAAQGWPGQVDVTAGDHRRPRATTRFRISPTDPIKVDFSEKVNGITGGSAVVQQVFHPSSEHPSFGPALPGSLVCRTPGGRPTDCQTGNVTRARFTPVDPLLPSSTYVMTLNPEFSLSVTDASGNPFDREELWLETTR